VRRGLAAAAFAAVVLLPTTVAAQARFFRTDTVFAMTVRTDLRTLYHDRDTVDVPWRPGSVTWTDSAGTHTVPARLRTRGIFRLAHCDVPPIRLRFDQDSVRGTALSGLHRPKLATHCMNTSGGEQNILQEYAIYRVLQLFTPWSYAVRLARVTYEDTTGRVRSQTRWAFLIEDPDRFAERMSVTADTIWGKRMGRLLPEDAALIGVFQYFIANTDWSMPGLHNVTVYRQADTLRAVPYDFDWSGTINAVYARPDARLHILSVRTRVYRGICQEDSVIAPVLERFEALRDSISTVYRAVPGLEPRNVERAIHYYGEFYEAAANRRDFMQHVVRPACLEQ